MGKQTTLGKLKPGNWFRFINDKERWVVGEKRLFYEDEDGEINKRECFSLQTGIKWPYPFETIVYRIKKT